MTEAKHVEDSEVTLSVVMGPQDTNGLGNVHGGVIMKMVDEAGGFAAMRHARRPCVTVVMDSMTFIEPIRVGDLVTFSAALTYAGRTSMEVRVEVVAENPIEGRSRRSNTAYLVFVALDNEGKPTPVPPLQLETEKQEQRAEEAKARQAYRKQQQSRETS
jgi:acyl-CoA hydrolase